MNLSFIKLDINIMNDSKIKFIRKMPDGDKILVLWIGILCLGMKSGKPGVVEIGDGIPFTAETLSTELDIPLNTIKLGLDTFTKFKMIEMWDNSEIFIVNFEKHQNLEKIRAAKQKSRITSKNHRKKMKKLTGVTVTQSSRDGHVTDSDNTERERDIEKDIETPPENNIDDFDEFWELYDKPIDKKKCKAKWEKITKKNKVIIFKTLSIYIQSTPDKKYRKNPATYLNGESWNDEIVNNQKPKLTMMQKAF